MQAGNSFFNHNTPTIVIRSLFDKYDVDRNGKLEGEELRVLLQADLGMTDKEACIYSILLDKNGDHSISFEEFTDWLQSGEKFQSIKDGPRFRLLCQATDYLKMFDVRKVECLNKAQFQHVLNYLGFQVTNAGGVFDGMASKTNGGDLSFSDFIRWLNWVPIAM